MPEMFNFDIDANFLEQIASLPTSEVEWNEDDFVPFTAYDFAVQRAAFARRNWLASLAPPIP